MGDKKSEDSKCEDFDEVIVFPDGRILRVDPKTKECTTEGCEEASGGAYYAPPVGVCGYSGLMTNPTPYPMPYPTSYQMPYTTPCPTPCPMPCPTPYQMPYTTPCPMPHPMPYPISQPMSYTMPYPRWPMKFKAKKKEEKVWKEYKSDSGCAYYYNTVTNKTQWEKPKDLDEKKKDKKPEDERPRPPQKPPRKYTNM